MFSVVIPLYNSEKTIKITLDSIKNQTRVDLIEEVLIINDGSTDSSLEIVNDYKIKNPELNIKIFSQENKGVSAARNVGLKNAKAEWIALIDSDDIWFPKKTELQYEVLVEHPEIELLGCCPPNFRILFRRKERLFKANIKEMCWRPHPGTITMVFRKSALEKVGLFEEGKNYCEDNEFKERFCVKSNVYVLCEDVCRIDIHKRTFAESGLTSHLREMHIGRCDNLRKLYKEKVISAPRYYSMQFLNQIKYIRRRIIVKINLIRVRNKKIDI